MVKVYKRKPYPVEAIKFERENIDEIKKWCPSIIISTPLSPSGQMFGEFDAMDCRRLIFEGDYLFKDNNGFHSYKECVFDGVYELD